MAFDMVSEENVYTCIGHPQRTDIANMVEWMLNKDFATAYNGILSTIRSLLFCVIFLAIEVH